MNWKHALMATISASIFWVGGSVLPQLLLLLKRWSGTESVSGFNGANDVVNFVRHVPSVANGQLMSTPDPILRYIPMAIVYRVSGSVIGPFEPATAVIATSFAIGVIIVPIVVLSVAVRDQDPMITPALALVFFTLATMGPVVVPGIAISGFSSGNYQYAIALPTALCALRIAEVETKPIAVGVLLGLTANIQLAIAIFAAAASASGWAARGKLSQIATAAITTLIISSPTIAIYLTSGTGGQTLTRGTSVAGVVSLMAIIGVVAVPAVWSQVGSIPDGYRITPFIAALILGLVSLIIGQFSGWYWAFVAGIWLQPITAIVGSRVLARRLNADA